jgi:hypothetical protein
MLTTTYKKVCGAKPKIPLSTASRPNEGEVRDGVRSGLPAGAAAQAGRKSSLPAILEAMHGRRVWLLSVTTESDKKVYPNSYKICTNP